jgi:hypothetical protein
MRRRVFLSGVAASTFVMLTAANSQANNKGGKADKRQFQSATTTTTTTTTLPPPESTTTTTTTTTQPPSEPTSATPSSPVGDWTGHVVVDSNTVLAHDIAVDSLTVAPGVTLTLDPSSNVAIQSRGNVVVEGTLSMQPATADIAHTITFVDVDESAMLGSTAGHSGPIPEDVGLWTIGHGRLQLDGAPKVAWCRSSGAISAGQATFTADTKLDGWRVGDEVVITPTGHTDRAPHRSTITAIDGQKFTLASPTPKAHPAVNVWGAVYSAEFLNLTRNVKIQGTPQGRAHTVFLHCHRPQHISFVEYAHLGPMGPTGGSVHNPMPFLPLGRWAFHFHHGGDHVAGSTIKGVVCRDIGTFAFVPHLADGITFTDCVAHNVGIGAYWWDDHQAVAAALGEEPTTRTLGDVTNRAVFTRCVASHVQGTKAWDGTQADAHNKFGWSMGNGRDNATIDCVAAGVITDGRFEGGGYSWQSTHSGVWATNGSLAHNSTKGIDLWNNWETEIIIHEGMTQYHCDRPLRDGAYRTVCGWADTAVLGQVQSVAGKRTTSHQQFVVGPRPDFVRLRVDADGKAPYAFLGANHHQPFLSETTPLVVSVADSEFKGGTVACVGFNSGEGFAHVYEFINPVFHGNEWWLENVCPADSVITWKRSGHRDVVLRPVTFTGDTSKMTWHPKWNAWAS